MMDRPENVKKFEILAYVGTGVGVFTLLLQLAKERYSMWAFILVFGGLGLIIRLLLIWFTVQRRANWARFTLVVFLVLSIVGMMLSFFAYLNVFMGIGITTIMFLSSLGQVVKIALEILALSFVFSPSANQWFSVKK